jgi:antitoxin (DNA-binding transcriptional repressor) of toxin-antitoxin stability system
MAERGGGPEDVWQRMADACAECVHESGEAIALTYRSAAADRLVALQERMTAELAKVDTLVLLARSQFPHERVEPSPRAASDPMYQQLRRAVTDFATCRERITSVVTTMPTLAEPDLG